MLAWWIGRRPAQPRSPAAAVEPLGLWGWLVALVTLLAILGLFSAVVAGYVYAVEAAAGAFTLFVVGLATRSLRAEALAVVLRDTMAVTGALFALLVAATTFTLVIRAFGTDRLIEDLVAQIPGGATGAVVAVLLVRGGALPQSFLDYATPELGPDAVPSGETPPGFDPA